MSDESEILEWLREYDVGFDESKYHIHNGIIDVDGNVFIKESCKSLPYKFGNVSGQFNIGWCETPSLENCPDYVGGYFDCNYINIKSLQGIPKVIGNVIYFRDCEQLEDISELYNVTFLSDELLLYKTIDSPNVAEQYSEWLRYISTIKNVSYYER